MQNKLLVFLLAVANFSCSSDEFTIKESEVPPNVLATFQAKYPAATDRQWQAEKEDDKFYFEVDFKDGGEEKELQITSAGSIVPESE